MPQLSPGQASYVLERMIDDRRVSARDVGRYVSEMQREISDLERRLQSLRQASAGNGGGRQVRAARGPRATASKAKPKRGRRVSAEQRASRKLQGRYLGLIRQIPASRRSQYQKIAKERGREAAVKEMASVLGK